MNKKFEAFFIAIFDIHIIVSNPQNIENVMLATIEHYQGSKGTPSNPILIEEYPII